MAAEVQNKQGEFNLYYKYLKDVKKYPLLHKKEEVELIGLAQNGDKKAFDMLIRRMGKYKSGKTRIKKDKFGRLDKKELQKKFGLTKNIIDDISKWDKSPISLDIPKFSDSDISLVDTLTDQTFEVPDSSAIEDSTQEFIGKKMEQLSEMERKIVNLFFGLDSGQAMSLGQIGEMFALSKERIGQIKEGALEKLRKGTWEREYLLVA